MRERDWWQYNSVCGCNLGELIKQEETFETYSYIQNMCLKIISYQILYLCMIKECSYHYDFPNEPMLCELFSNLLNDIFCMSVPYSCVSNQSFNFRYRLFLLCMIFRYVMSMHNYIIIICQTDQFCRVWPSLYLQLCRRQVCLITSDLFLTFEM